MLRRIGRILFLAITGFVIGSLILVVIYREVPPPATPLMLIRRVEGYGIDKTWRPLDKISPNLVRAAMAGEDAKFCEHHGFDWDAIRDAWRRYQAGTRRLRGASTISMQTAKNVFLWPGRDWIRKGLEAYFTALIELAWGKPRIMEVYLNTVEMGPGVYGVEAAAQKYFHVSAHDVNPAQAARLIAILPSPLKWQVIDPGAYVRRRDRKIGAAEGTVERIGGAECLSLRD